MINNTNTVDKVKFVFIIDLSLFCHHHNLLIILLLSTSSILYKCKPTNSTCHFLCTPDPTPKLYNQPTPRPQP